MSQTVLSWARAHLRVCLDHPKKHYLFSLFTISLSHKTLFSASATVFCSATVFSTQSKHTRSTNHKYVCGSGCWFTVLSGVWCPRKPASPQSAGYPAQGRCHGNGSSPCRCAMQACGSRQEQLQHDLFAALSSRRRQSRHRRGRGSGSSANAVVPPLPTLHALSWLSGSRTNTHDTKQS